MSKGPERIENMVNGLRHWQGIERQAMADTAEVIEKTNNPFIRLIMEVIRHDSLMHHRVQQSIVDSLTRADVPITHEEIGAIWQQIEEHDAHEREVIEIAKGLREQAWQPIHKLMLDYLLADEEKHDKLLEALGELKKELAKATN